MDRCICRRRRARVHFGCHCLVLCSDRNWHHEGALLCPWLRWHVECVHRHRYRVLVVVRVTPVPWRDDHCGALETLGLLPFLGGSAVACLTTCLVVGLRLSLRTYSSTSRVWMPKGGLPFMCVRFNRAGHKVTFVCFAHSLRTPLLRVARRCWCWSNLVHVLAVALLVFLNAQPRHSSLFVLPLVW